MCPQIRMLLRNIEEWGMPGTRPGQCDVDKILIYQLTLDCWWCMRPHFMRGFVAGVLRACAGVRACGGDFYGEFGAQPLFRSYRSRSTM